MTSPPPALRAPPLHSGEGEHGSIIYYKEWKEEGIEEGKRELMRSLVRNNIFTPVQAAQYLNISEQEFMQFMQDHDRHVS